MIRLQSNQVILLAKMIHRLNMLHMITTVTLAMAKRMDTLKVIFKTLNGKVYYSLTWAVATCDSSDQ